MTCEPPWITSIVFPSCASAVATVERSAIAAMARPKLDAHRATIPRRLRLSSIDTPPLYFDYRPAPTDAPGRAAVGGKSWTPDPLPGRDSGVMARGLRTPDRDE